MDTSFLPHEPGCYLFKDSAGGILYVGKAKDLKKRVSSYFSKKDLDPKTSALVKKISLVDYIITGNEKEAFLLENNLIKLHQPRYNIDLKDSKRYAYIMLTREDFPRLLVARKKSSDGKYFGPFTSAENRDAVLYFANNVFCLRTCKKLPKRKCIRYDIGRCAAPCIGATDKEGYGRRIDDASSFLSGKNEALLSDLRKRMKDASGKQAYEEARILRDQITAIDALSEKQRVETQKSFDYDIVNYIVYDGKVYVTVFNVYSGILSNKDDYEFPYAEDFFEEFLLQYYSEAEIPKEIIVPEEVSGALRDYLSEKKGSQVRITLPSRGEKKELLDLVRRNAEKSFLEADLSVRDLGASLGMQKAPRAIECFDISHLSGTDTVGSMVSFRDGKPDKSNYRRFRIRSVDGIDDPAAIAEVVRRRYSRLLEEKKELPDLIVVDGGASQLSAAVRELRKLKLDVPAIGLAKREEEVYLPGMRATLRLNRRGRALHLLQRIRDEAHRFAIQYQRLRRTKRVLGKK